MKKILLLLYLFTITLTNLFAQTPNGFNYQAVVRDADGNILSNQEVAVHFDIKTGTATGTIVYSEDHNLTTNEFGLINLIIGTGTSTGSSFDEIDWTTDNHFLTVILNGTNLGTTQFLSVPYAKVAEKVAPKEQLLSISASAFTTNNNDSEYSHSLGQGGAEITNPGLTLPRLVAPVFLAHGARITEVKFYYRDNSTANLTLTLHRESLNTGTFSEVISYETTGTNPDWTSQTLPLNHVVNNNNYGYFIRVLANDWTAAGNKEIKGVTIKYTY